MITSGKSTLPQGRAAHENEWQQHYADRTRLFEVLDPVRLEIRHDLPKPAENDQMAGLVMLASHTKGRTLHPHGPENVRQLTERGTLPLPEPVPSH